MITEAIILGIFVFLGLGIIAVVISEMTEALKDIYINWQDNEIEKRKPEKTEKPLTTSEAQRRLRKINLDN